MARISVQIEAADALAFECDVLAIKHAQDEYGLDRQVLAILRQQATADLTPFHLAPAGARVFAGVIPLKAKRVLVVGTPPLSIFTYSDIREFGFNAVASLRGDLSDVKHLALTVHGVSCGLDETQSLQSEISGLIEAVRTEKYAHALELISIVELRPKRAQRLRSVLENLIQNNYLPNPAASFSLHKIQPAAATIENLTLQSAVAKAKPVIFVAMPFAESMDDIFHYGIQGAVNAAGYLCERADLTAFTGDVVDWVKRRITGSSLVIADLSAANPNVYLEVCFAWGCGIPTILLASNDTQLKFDVRGQRCLLYKSIKTLEDILTQELLGLSSSAAAT
jgi:hypothetical protein